MLNKCSVLYFYGIMNEKIEVEKYNNNTHNIQPIIFI